MDVAWRTHLGSLLFMIYFNDKSGASNITMFILFADDINLFFKHHNLNNLFNNINFELDKIAVWLKINKLSLNIKITSYFLFDSDNIQVYKLGLDIFIDNVKGNQVDHT